RKIAASLSSTGSPALFLHAAESLHGDIGVLSAADALLILSYSGATEGIDVFLRTVKNIGAPIVAMTGNPSSPLARGADALILVDIEREACPYNLAPTSSTTAMLALGDAIALSLLELKGFKPENFASLHPGGALGRKLLLKAKDIIEKKNANPLMKATASVKEALILMTTSRSGATSVVDDSGKLVGYFTDGDLRRKIQEDPDLLERKIGEVMTVNPRKISPDTLAIVAKDIFRKNRFDNMPVVDSEGRPVGILDERDILESGL
ncbi:MAG: KpsF/GutQ family sugar-phosphate isomerase, partial [Elusimicrobia bacterium]|nr:KpsF/GutQ family sugar-phosphate isomerase [Elusimicrobiota bacterium]